MGIGTTQTKGDSPNGDDHAILGTKLIFYTYLKFYQLIRAMLSAGILNF
jgi:hypothetical protein